MSYATTCHSMNANRDICALQLLNHQLVTMMAKVQNDEMITFNQAMESKINTITPAMADSLYASSNYHNSLNMGPRNFTALKTYRKAEQKLGVSDSWRKLQYLSIS